jgi:chitinase
MNWTTNVLSTQVTGTLQTLVSAMPAGDTTITLAFATGTCGSETWAAMPLSTIVANLPAFVSSGKYYIVSTGGEDGAFLCPTTSAFQSFVASYYTTHMLGVDFDLEAGQTQAQVTALVQDVKAAEVTYPNLRFSFTVPSLGGIPPAFSAEGDYVMSAIKSVGLTKYTINLMVMDYGSAGAYTCVVVSGACEMGQSADQGAEDLHSQYGVPYSQIELTPMIGGNDSAGETFTIPDVATVSTFVKQNGLAGVHFWSIGTTTAHRVRPSQPATHTARQARSALPRRS